MIIRCQNGSLLNSDHVVEWDKHTEGERNEEEHTVIAKDYPRHICRGF